MEGTIITVDGEKLLLKSGLTLIASDQGNFDNFFNGVVNSKIPTRSLTFAPYSLTSPPIYYMDFEALGYMETIFKINVQGLNECGYNISKIRYEYRGSAHMFSELPTNMQLAILFAFNLDRITRENEFKIIFCNRLDALFHPDMAAKLAVFVLVMSRMHPDKSYLYATNSNEAFNTILQYSGGKMAINDTGGFTDYTSPDAVYLIDNSDISIWLESEDHVREIEIDEDGYPVDWSIGFFLPDIID